MTQLHTNSTRIAESQLVTRRGRQRTPTPWLMSVVCRLGVHQGQWAYVAEGNCPEWRECGRCGSVHVRTKHQREWRYVSDGRCEQAQLCTRCEAASGDRIEHLWGDSWEVETSWWQGNKEAHRCLRCGVVKEWTVSYG